MKVKSILASTTFWGAIGSLLISVSAVAGRVFIDGDKFTSKDLETLITISVTTLVTVIGRVNASSSVYTPHLLPGPNKEDLVAQQEEGSVF
jgi:hypothetical protein